MSVLVDPGAISTFAFLSLVSRECMNRKLRGVRSALVLVVAPATVEDDPDAKSAALLARPVGKSLRFLPGKPILTAKCSANDLIAVLNGPVIQGATGRGELEVVTTDDPIELERNLVR